MLLNLLLHLPESHLHLHPHLTLHLHTHLNLQLNTHLIIPLLLHHKPSPTHQSPGAEHHFPTPHDSPLHAVHSHGSDEGSLKLNELMNLVTKLSDRIGVLEDDLKKTKKTYSSAYTKLILMVQEKASTETELFIQEVTPTEVIQAQEGSEKGSDEVSTAGAKKGTASEEVQIVSIAERLQDNGMKRKDKELWLKPSLTKQIDWNDPSVIRSKMWYSEGNEKRSLKETGAKRNNLFLGKAQGRGQRWRKDAEREKYSASRHEGYDLMLWEDLYYIYLSLGINFLLMEIGVSDSTMVTREEISFKSRAVVKDVKQKAKGDVCFYCTVGNGTPINFSTPYSSNDSPSVANHLHNPIVQYSCRGLVQIPSEFEDSSKGECDLPPYDDSSRNHDLTFSNPLFDINEDFTSSDESFSEEDVPNENFKIFSNTLFDLDEEITSTKVDQINDEVLENTNSIPPGIAKDVRFDAESYLLESLVNHDTLMASPPNSLYDNSSPRPPEAFQDNSNTIIESFPIFPIPVKDSDSLREEIDIFPCPDDSIPPGIESDDFDSEGDNNSTSLPEFESFHVDYPDSGDSTIDVVEDIPVDVPNILPTHPTLHMDFDFIPSHNDLGSDLDVSSPSGDRNKIYDPGICIEVESTRFLAPLSPVIDTLLPFSSENEDKVFNHGVLAYKEKSPPSSSHRGLKAFQLSPESPMLIHGDNTPNLGVRHPHFYPP
ncbi:hypothetical protein Tco_0157224 [Tanacetum coccineum]